MNNEPSFSNQSGQIVVLSVIIVGLVLLNSLVVIGGAQVFFKSTNYVLQEAQAVHLAEAGIDKAVASLNTTGGNYVGETETFLGQGSYSVSITSVSNNSKTIESTGYIPSKSQPKVKRTIKINAQKGIGAAFRYGIQTGAGGLVMNENSIVNGSVYSNGNIQLDNNARINGDAYVASGVQSVADQQNDCASSDCTDFIFGKNINGEERSDIAQSFKLSSDSVVNKVSISLKKTGSPADLTVRILADKNNAPDKNNILATGNLPANLVSTNYNFIDVYFSSPPSLSAETSYWLMLDASVSSSNYWSWSSDLIQGYTRGEAKWSSNWQTGSPIWMAINGDLSFEIFIGGIPNSIIGSNGATIAGNAHANTLKFLTINGDAYYKAKENITAANYYPGSDDPVAMPMPLSSANIEQWKNAAEALAVYNGDINTCPSSLPAGKYQGSISLPSNCTVTASSPIWVTGNMTMSNGNTIRLDSTFGPSSGVIIIDNFITLNNGNRIEGSGTQGSYLILLSEFNSRDDPLLRAAISITNKDNSGIIYSNLGLINIANNNSLTEISAWKLELGNNVIVNYDQGLASAFFSSGPSGAFALVKGTYQLKQ